MRSIIEILPIRPEASLTEQRRLQGLMDWAYQKYVESQKRVDQIKFSNIFMGYFVQYTTLKKIEDIDL